MRVFGKFTFNLGDLVSDFFLACTFGGLMSARMYVWALLTFLMEIDLEMGIL